MTHGEAGMQEVTQLPPGAAPAEPAAAQLWNSAYSQPAGTVGSASEFTKGSGSDTQLANRGLEELINRDPVDGILDLMRAATKQPELVAQSAFLQSLQIALGAENQSPTTALAEQSKPAEIANCGTTQIQPQETTNSTGTQVPQEIANRATTQVSPESTTPTTAQLPPETAAPTTAQVPPETTTQVPPETATPASTQIQPQEAAYHTSPQTLYQNQGNNESALVTKALQDMAINPLQGLVELLEATAANPSILRDAGLQQAILNGTGETSVSTSPQFMKQTTVGGAFKQALTDAQKDPAQGVMELMEIAAQSPAAAQQVISALQQLGSPAAEQTANGSQKTQVNSSYNPEAQLAQNPPAPAKNTAMDQSGQVQTEVDQALTDLEKGQIMQGVELLMQVSASGIDLADDPTFKQELSAALSPAAVNTRTNRT